MNTDIQPQSSTLHPPDCQCSDHIPLVKITIDVVENEVIRGSHPVAELKELGSIPSDAVLAQRIDGHLKRLPNDGSVEIVGSEVFVNCVTVRVDEEPVEVHRGHHTVPDLKKAFRLGQAEELDQLIDGARQRLTEGMPIHVVGGEIFRCLVVITINDRPYQVTRGVHTVVDLKKISGVPLADELEQIIDRKLQPLPDNGSVRITGCEIFVSHPRTGQTS